MQATPNTLLRTLTAAALVALATPAWAQLSTTANGPYYATPSWSQKLTINRFVILANWNSEAVLDRETGLVWERTVRSRTNPQTASQRCIIAGTGGRSGWRLPTINELMSLFDPAETNRPYFPAGHPFMGIDATQSDYSLLSATPALPVSGNLYESSRHYAYGWRAFGIAMPTIGRWLHTKSGLEEANSLCVRGGVFSFSQ